MGERYYLQKSFFFRTYGPGKPLMNTILCTGSYEPILQNLQPRFPFGSWILLNFVIYVCFWAPIYSKQKKLEKMEQENAPVNINQFPKSLESLLLHLMNLIINIFASVCTAKMNRYLCFKKLF